MSERKSFECFGFCRALGQTDLARITVTGARGAFEKHKETCESKGIKAHFQLDENCLLVLDRVNHRENIFLSHRHYILGGISLRTK